ncbi:polyprenyl synthetase family protein [Lentibacillus sp. N15]|uniref:polyprenyl synthetase family protein n=1 Tax=Lentibacillus songyuanensis TaxID=3136161 RepID=UPI0031BBCD52
MPQTLNKYIEQNKAIIHEELRRYLNHLQIPNRLKEAMLYSLEAGGKRLRPILVIASFEAYNVEKNNVLSAAIALEMVHTYSLIHDDLPAMDDDDFRRGKPTNHRVFDEATAILAGDALLTYSFEIIADDPLLSETQKVKLIKMLSQASGPKGMVAGQMLDMEAENTSVALEALEEIHARKTGELIVFAIIAGAYIGGATTKQLDHLYEFACSLGLLFQVQDDILDVIGDEDKLGKPVGSDENNHKSTYPKLLGLEGAKEKKRFYVEKAKRALEKAGADNSYLMDLTNYFSSRDR